MRIMQLWCSKKFKIAFGKPKRKFSAAGLVEVIVVIGIISVTMVSVMGVTIKSMRQVKKDEIEDRAMGFELRSLELAKSPATFQFPGNLQVGDLKRYSVKTGDTSGGSTILFAQSISSAALTTTNCDKNSEYNVTVQGAGTGEVYCNQIIVEVKTQSGKNYYQVTSVMVYKSLDTFVQDQLVTYRRD